MNILQYIPFTAQNRRRKLLNELAGQRHSNDDILTDAEKAEFDRVIAALKTAPAGKAPEKEAEKAAAKLGKRNMVGDWLDLFLVVGAVAFGLRALYFQPFRIPTSSMQPTLYGIHHIDKEHEGSPLLGKNKLVNALLYAAKETKCTVKADGMLDRDSLAHDASGFFGETIFSIGGKPHSAAGDPAKVIDFAKLDPYRIYRKNEVIADGYISLGDHLFVERFSIYLTALKRGDVIVFTTENLYDENNEPVINGGFFYIKRLAALPGDTIKIVENQLWVKPANEKSFQKIQDISEPFQKVYSGKGGYHGHISEMGAGAFAAGGEYTVPADHYFMLGDNSQFSKDSRFFGPVPRRNIMGRAFLVFWPFSRRAGLVDKAAPVDIPTGNHGAATFPVMSKQ
ncbi:MAG: signal peptidase I [Lentisphaeria bacterium]|nr:signal peptidase I [Lentisphaeria bacterium]